MRKFTSQASDFIPGLLSLPLEKVGRIGIGGVVIGASTTGTGDGVLGTLSFEVLNGFAERTELVLTQISLNRVPEGEQIQQVRQVVTITAEDLRGGLAGDFNGDGEVDFSDFFLFADGFGRGDTTYDLNGDGEVNFSDFFRFADLFGGEERAKLMALANGYLGLPATPLLGQNFPNPFNANTAIPLALSQPDLVRLEIFDAVGRRVRQLVNGRLGGGMHQVVWNGRDEEGVSVSSGVYLCRLQAGSFRQVRRMLLLK